MPEPRVLCEAKAASCVCAKPTAHVEAGDEVHACDPSDCTGSWRGDFDDTQFNGGKAWEPITIPRPVRSETRMPPGLGYMFRCAALRHRGLSGDLVHDLQDAGDLVLLARMESLTDEQLTEVTTADSQRRATELANPNGAHQ